MRDSHPPARETNDDTIIVEIQRWGRIAVVWPGGRLALLFDDMDAVLSWDDKCVRRIEVGEA